MKKRRKFDWLAILWAGWWRLGILVQATMVTTLLFMIIALIIMGIEALF